MLIDSYPYWGAILSLGKFLEIQEFSIQKKTIISRSNQEK